MENNKHNKSFRKVYKSKCPHCKHKLVSPEIDDLYSCENCGRETGLYKKPQLIHEVNNGFLLNDSANNGYYAFEEEPFTADSISDEDLETYFGWDGNDN